jgi:hypothetical protein
MDPALHNELLALEAEDLRIRAQLAGDGSGFQGYRPTMEAIHRRNAARLRAIITEFGWPGRLLVGDEGAKAAWRIAQHAIGEPGFQRNCLALLQVAATRRDVPAWQPACLEDRIRLFEGRGQLYGTQFEPDAEGYSVPSLIDDPEHVDERRRRVGLRPLAERMKQAEWSEPMSPEARATFDREYLAWLRRVGWRK